MTHRSLPCQPTPEDRLTFAKWKRGTAIIYGCALLPLVAWIATPRILAEPTTATAVVDGPASVASHVVGTNIARRD
jgi:hypothetical protein